MCSFLCHVIYCIILTSSLLHSKSLDHNHIERQSWRLHVESVSDTSCAVTVTNAVAVATDAAATTNGTIIYSHIPVSINCKSQRSAQCSFRFCRVCTIQLAEQLISNRVWLKQMRQFVNEIDNNNKNSYTQKKRQTAN